MNDITCSKTQCFAYAAGVCTVLDATIKKNCPFFKTKREAEEQRNATYKKLYATEYGRDLLEKYGELKFAADHAKDMEKRAKEGRLSID